MTEEESTRPAPLLAALGADLMRSSRLASIAAREGWGFASVRRPEELAAKTPALVLIDLGVPALDLAAAVRLARKAGARSVVAYGPHMDVEARRRALAAGCDRWLPNSRLFEALSELLSRRSDTAEVPRAPGSRPSS